MPPLHRILCAVDASAPSAQALRQAMACARWSGADLTVLHVAQPAQVPAGAMLAVPADVSEHDAEESIAKWMSAELGAIGRNDGVCACLVVASGSPAREIVKQAAELPADLVVIGTRGASGVERLLLGSVAERVLRTAPCPVMTVPPLGVARSRLPFERVLCALDFSECSLAALEYAMTAAIDFDASLTLAHVIEWPWSEPPAPDVRELPEAEAAALASFRRRREEYACRHLNTLIPARLSDRCHTRISHGRPHVELLRLADQEHADLIVLGVHGRNPIDIAMFGSTAQHIVRRAFCPVLTVRR